jgi:hypothetical protein
MKAHAKKPAISCPIPVCTSVFSPTRTQ